jgi:hypothetical protein
MEGILDDSYVPTHAGEDLRCVFIQQHFSILMTSIELFSQREAAKCGLS